MGFFDLFKKEKKERVFSEPKDLEVTHTKKISFEGLVANRTLVASITGYGKSYTIKKMIREIKDMIPIIIFDLEGEYSGLGIERITEGSDPETLAKKIISEKKSAVLDFSTTDDADMQEFVGLFCEAFLDLETSRKISYLLVFDEADEYVPEKGFNKSKCLNAIIKLVKKGRKRGIGMMFATQRLTYLSKNVISQCVNIIIGRTEWKSDVDVLRKYLGVEQKEADELKKLKPGEFFLRGPIVDEKGFVKFRR
ncbi:ATP-binding protein [Candidatus Woesearchaeota archaeon]|nr:ATP-binding protein [Candidatus Woesearchaeota archaeon]